MGTVKTQTEQETAQANESKSATAYTVDELVASAQAAFKVQPEVIIGALQFKYEGDKKKFTKAEVRTAIKEFKAKEVK